MAHFPLLYILSKTFLHSSLFFFLFMVSNHISILLIREKKPGFVT